MRAAASHGRPLPSSSRLPTVPRGSARRTGGTNVLCRRRSKKHVSEWCRCTGHQQLLLPRPRSAAHASTALCCHCILRYGTGCFLLCNTGVKVCLSRDHNHNHNHNHNRNRNRNHRKLPPGSAQPAPSTVPTDPCVFTGAAACAVQARPADHRRL